jgi:hypothetical protein
LMVLMAAAPPPPDTSTVTAMPGPRLQLDLG